MTMMLSVLLTLTGPTTCTEVETNRIGWLDFQSTLEGRAHLNYIRFPQELWEAGYEIAEDRGRPALVSLLNLLATQYSQFILAGRDRNPIGRLIETTTQILAQLDRARCRSDRVL